jgi:hypothetical protein
MYRGAGRDSIRLAAGIPHRLDRVLPALADANIEVVRYNAAVGAHQAGQQDIADTVIDCVLVRHPAFLHDDAFHADLGGYGGDHAGVIGLHAADRD